MQRRTLCPVTATVWVIAVLGAAAVLVGPITPWVGLVEMLGAATCVVACVVLVAWYLRP